MRSIKPMLAIIMLALISGCYNASILTDKTPSSVVIDKPWALSFVYGLVPPTPIDASETCKDGIAKVETKLSFLNQVVSALSGGLITPMHITVTCAAPGSTASLYNDDHMIDVPENATSSELQDIYKYASDLAVKNGAPVYVAQ